MSGQGIVSKMVQSLKDIVNCSDSEIYTMLVECNMDPNETVMRLLSQDTFQKVKSKRNKKKDTEDQAEPSRRRIPNGGARNSAKDSYNTAQGGGNKFNSNGSETKLAQNVGPNKRGNHWAGSSSAPSPNSDIKNAEVKKAAPTGSSSLPEPAYQFAWAKANPRKKTMAEIVKMGKPLHQKKFIAPPSSETQESGSKAPGSSLENQDVADPVSSLLKPAAEPKTLADQVSQPQHVDESQMQDEVSKTSYPDVDQVAQCSYLRFGSFDVKIVSGQSSSVFNDNLEDTQDTEDNSSSSHLDTNGKEDEEEELRDNATDEQTSYEIDSTVRNDHASSDSEREAARHEQPPQRDPHMQNLDNLFTNVIDLRDANISPQQAAYLYQHSALNAYYHQHGMPLGHHGNFISDPFMHHGYMHSGFQQRFLVGSHLAPLAGILPLPASSFQQQNKNTVAWHQIKGPNMRVAPRGGAYSFRGHPSQQPPGFVQSQQLHQQQLSRQAAMSLDQLHPHHQHQHRHRHHHQRSAGEGSSKTQEQLWLKKN